MGKHNEEPTKLAAASTAGAPAATYAASCYSQDLMRAKTPSKFRLMSQQELKEKRCQAYEYAF